MTSEIGKPYAGKMYGPDYELRETKRGFQVVLPEIRGGKVRRFRSMSPVYRDRVAAESHLAARQESARQFSEWCDAALRAAAAARELEFGR